MNHPLEFLRNGINGEEKRKKKKELKKIEIMNYKTNTVID